MFLVCHVISQEHVIKGSMTLWVEALIVSHHPAKFGGHRHCGSGNINLPANTVILSQMRDICIYPLTSAIFIFCKAHGMSGATRVSNHKLRDNFYGNIFSVSNEISPILIIRFLGNE